MAMEQQDRGPGAAMTDPEGRLGRCDEVELEALEHRMSLIGKLLLIR
jgi:hypothetical protein